MRAIHEPRCNTSCEPDRHHLTDGIGMPHIHRTDLAMCCGECRTPAADLAQRPEQDEPEEAS
jgi:hypothetical protein